MLTIFTFEKVRMILSVQGQVEVAIEDFGEKSEILSHSKLKLVDKYLLEGTKVVLLIENKHSLLVVDRIDRAETQRTITICYQDGIAGDASRALVAV